MLNLTKVGFDNRCVTVFSSWVKACEHICDHLLTPPEARAWSLLIPPLRVLLESRAYFELAKRIWTDSDEEGRQKLYDEYAGQIRLCLASAEKEGWYGEDFTWEGARWLLGVNGFVAIISPKYIITAYIPDLGDPNMVSSSSNKSDEEIIRERRSNPLPRYSAECPLQWDENDTLPDADRIMQNFNNSVSYVRRQQFLWYQDGGLDVPVTFEEWRAENSELT